MAVDRWSCRSPARLVDTGRRRIGTGRRVTMAPGVKMPPYVEAGSSPFHPGRLDTQDVQDGQYRPCEPHHPFPSAGLDVEVGRAGRNDQVGRSGRPCRGEPIAGWAARMTTSRPYGTPWRDRMPGAASMLSNDGPKRIRLSLRSRSSRRGCGSRSRSQAEGAASVPRSRFAAPERPSLAPRPRRACQPPSSAHCSRRRFDLGMPLACPFPRENRHRGEPKGRAAGAGENQQAFAEFRRVPCSTRLRSHPPVGCALIPPLRAPAGR